MVQLTDEYDTGVSNEQYDLISVLYHSLESAATYEVYIQDAEEAEDQELTDFFQELHQQDRQRADQARQLLAKRLSQMAGR